MAEIDRTAGDIEHAMEMYQKVLDVNPENEKAKYNIPTLHSEELIEWITSVTTSMSKSTRIEL